MSIISYGDVSASKLGEDDMVPGLDHAHIPHIHNSAACAAGLLHRGQQDTSHTAWAWLVHLDEHPVTDGLHGLELLGQRVGGGTASQLAPVNAPS
mmetsp:Transcript_31497/g.27878  ORF Transcript_31497/g.27878 Transcript_31497/m.27878 type:complete len:95 (-) Transcript_31497:29-313(-)